MKLSKYVKYLSKHKMQLTMKPRGNPKENLSVALLSPACFGNHLLYIFMFLLAANMLAHPLALSNIVVVPFLNVSNAYCIKMLILFTAKIRDAIIK